MPCGPTPPSRNPISPTTSSRFARPSARRRTARNTSRPCRGRVTDSSHPLALNRPRQYWPPLALAAAAGSSPWPRLLALSAVVYLGFARGRDPRVEPCSDPFPRSRDRAPRRIRDVRGFAGWPAARLCRRRRRWRDAPVAANDERTPAGPMQGTEVFTIVPPMIWSPDSRFIAYDATGILKKAASTAERRRRFASCRERRLAEAGTRAGTSS